MTEEFLEQLILKYAHGTASAHEIEVLRSWFNDVSTEDVHLPVPGTDGQKALYQRMLQRLKAEVSPVRVRPMYPAWAKIAALMILIASAALIAYFVKAPASFIEVTNSYGKIQLVRLPDSSAVWLNASSSVRYAKNFKTNRKIDLDGEAYFEVTHDATHPFIVTAGDIHTTVLGTGFDVKAYSTESSVSVVVVKGRVGVESNDQQLAVLMPSFQLQYDKNTRLAQTSQVDTSNITAWKNGKLEFRGESLGAIANTLQRWYGVTIVFADPRLRDCRYYVSFDNSISLDKLLAAMSEAGGLRYVQNQPGTITLLGNACH